jgi:Tol biopolymer transport system component
MPSVSANGILAYVADIDGGMREIYYRQVNSAAETRVGEGSLPRISTSGNQILYSRGDSAICMYDLTNGKTINLTPYIGLENLQTPDWGPGNSIIFASGKFPDLKVYSFEIPGKKLTLLTPEEGLRYGCVSSPDKKRIAYRCAKGKPGPGMKKGIAILDLSTREERFITNTGEYCSWSPDGKSLAFQWPDSTKGFCIYTVNADGTGLKMIASANGHDAELPAWSPDGKTIFFEKNERRGNWEIWKMNPDGTGQQRLLPKG